MALSPPGRPAPLSFRDPAEIMGCLTKSCLSLSESACFSSSPHDGPLCLSPGGAPSFGDRDIPGRLASLTLPRRRRGYGGAGAASSQATPSKNAHRPIGVGSACLASEACAVGAILLTSGSPQLREMPRTTGEATSAWRRQALLAFLKRTFLLGGRRQPRGSYAIFRVLWTHLAFCVRDL